MFFSAPPILVAPGGRPVPNSDIHDRGAAASAPTDSAECAVDPFADPPLACAPGAGMEVGRYTVNVLPLPTSLCSLISPPSRLVSSRQIDRPRPVPPYLRLVVPSAWANAPNTDCCFFVGMPMPVSATLNAMTPSARLSETLSADHPEGAGSAENATLPDSVNLNALLSRLLRICCSRCGSVGIVFGKPGFRSIVKPSLVASAT